MNEPEGIMTNTAYPSAEAAKTSDQLDGGHWERCTYREFIYGWRIGTSTRQVRVGPPLEAGNGFWYERFVPDAPAIPLPTLPHAVIRAHVKGVDGPVTLTRTRGYWVRFETNAPGRTWYLASRVTRVVEVLFPGVEEES